MRQWSVTAAIRCSDMTDESCADARSIYRTAAFMLATHSAQMVVSGTCLLHCCNVQAHSYRAFTSVPCTCVVSLLLWCSSIPDAGCGAACKVLYVRCGI